MTDRPTNQRTDMRFHREITLLIINHALLLYVGIYNLGSDHQTINPHLLLRRHDWKAQSKQSSSIIGLLAALISGLAWELGFRRLTSNFSVQTNIRPYHFFFTYEK